MVGATRQLYGGVVVQFVLKKPRNNHQIVKVDLPALCDAVV
jgi:hypothetical protein